MVSKINPLITYLAGYGPSACADNMYDEHVQRTAEELGVEALYVRPPNLDELVALFESAEPKNVILTGTAGDGKTYLERVIHARLGGSQAQWRTQAKWVDLELPNSGRVLRIVRDLSEFAEPEKEAHFPEIDAALRGESAQRVYLIASNDGHLVQFFRRFASTQAQRDTGERIASMLNEGRTEDPGLDLRLLNLSRQSHESLFGQVVEAVVRHEGWGACDGCAAIGGCAIRANWEMLFEGARMRERLGEVISLAACSDEHLPIRQLFLLTVNIVLGDSAGRQGLLDCASAAARVAEGAGRESSPFDNALGYNLSSTERRQYPPFALMERFSIGRETNNAVDGLIVDGQPAALWSDLEACEPRFGDRVFRDLRLRYLRGQIEDYEEIRPDLEAQRRRLFFVLDDDASIKPSAHSLKPWNLTVFLHGAQYLRFREALREDRSSTMDYSIKAPLICGLNRALTGTMTRADRDVWLVSPVGNSEQRLGCVVEARIPAAGNAMVAVGFDFDAEGVNARPRLVVRERGGFEVALELRPLLFEYLLRVAEGSLPASFSRQCYEEVRFFRLRLVGALQEAGLCGREDLLDGIERVEIDDGGELRARPVRVRSVEA